MGLVPWTCNTAAACSNTQGCRLKGYTPFTCAALIHMLVVSCKFLALHLLLTATHQTAVDIWFKGLACCTHHQRSSSPVDAAACCASA
jgi:hypothetical protein